MYVCMYVCVYVCMYVRMYVCMYICYMISYNWVTHNTNKNHETIILYSKNNLFWLFSPVCNIHNLNNG